MCSTCQAVDPPCIQAIDIAANRVVFTRLYSFRGDSDEAWQRAEAFIACDIRAALSAP